MNKRLKEKEIITSLQDAWDENNKERFLSIVYYLENTRRITSKEAKILKTVYDDWEEYKSENPNAKISFAGDIKIRMDIKENKNMNKRLEEKRGNTEDEKLALAEFKDVEVDDIEDGYTDHVYEVDGEEYWVSDYDTAYDEAVEECENLFDDLGLEAVSESTQEYFLENEDYCTYDWKSDMHDSNLSYATDIDSESGDDGYATRLVSEAIDRKVIKDEDCFENDDGELDYEDKDELAEMLADDLDDDYDSMSEWFESIYGRGWVKEMRDTLKDYLDYHAMAEYVVDEDSIANTLARYDGKENTEKVNGVEYYIYRTN